MNIEDHILALVAKKLANGASEEELKELDTLLQQHPDVHNMVKLMAEWWQSDTEESIEANSYFRFQKVMERIKANDPSLKRSETLQMSLAKQRRQNTMITYLVNRCAMIATFLKIAWRNAQKNVTYSASNIFGLATGMSVVFFFGFWLFFFF